MDVLFVQQRILPTLHSKYTAHPSKVGRTEGLFIYLNMNEKTLSQDS